MATKTISASLLFSLIVFAVYVDQSLAELTRRSRFSRSQTACTGQIGDLAVGSGSITSPNFPEIYPRDADCQWKLTAPSGERINITSSFFSLELSDGCLFDHVMIYEGADEESPRLGSFCGNEPFSVSTSANQAFVVFFSDQSYENVGFNLSYTISTEPVMERALPPKPDCNSTFTGVPGYFLSPNYPLPADKNTFCTYTLVADTSDKVVELVFASFSLEQNAFCGFDHLLIFDGSSQDDPELGRYCGHQRPPLIRSTNSTMLIQYRTDYLLQQRGFNATFKFVDPQSDPFEMAEGHAECSQLMEQDKGVVSSPGYPREYPLDKVCITVIRAPPEKFVKLTLHSFKLEDETGCVFDSLTLYDGPTEDHTMLESFCGTRLLPDTSFTSSSRTMRLKFISDLSVTEKGFNATYQFVSEGGTIECNMGCENDGECVQEDDGPVCECHLPFSGDKCEIAPRNCSDNPCQNGGTCVSLKGEPSYLCGCPEGLEGEHCTLSTPEPELKFTVKPSNKTQVPLKSQVFLECKVNREKPDIRWMFNRDMFLESDSVVSQQLGVEVYPGGTGVLEIPHLTQNNVGVYTCVAVDGEENISHNVWVTTDAPCNLGFTHVPQNASERVDTVKHVLKCFADGALRYEWKKNDIDIEYDERVKFLGTSFLRIDNLQASDNGKYTCQVTSEDGCVQRKSAWLKVLGSSNLNKICGRPALYKPGGQRRGRISSGWEAKPGSHPWYVLIRNLHSETSFCGGSLISDEWVLTAAHCILTQNPLNRGRPFFEKEHTRLFVGSNSCFGEKGMELKIAEVKVHEKYNHAAQDYNYDIALIRVHKKVAFNTKIKPVCLKSRSFIEANFFRSTDAGYVAGCGRIGSRSTFTPRRLMEVKVRMHSRDICKTAAPQTFTENMICAGYRTAGRGDACTGDSGGGLVLETQNRHVLVGIVSWGKGCDEKGQYGYYTHVGRFFDWIHKTIAISA